MKDPKAGVYPTAVGNGPVGRSYVIPTYKVTDNGIEDGEGLILNFCKGNKLDPDAFRQEGVFTESLLEACKQYLEAVNVGDLENPFTSMAIIKIREALMWINERAEDRKRREVQGTYEK